MEQASAIPFRRREGAIEYCLITTVNKGHWAFPKGIIDPGESFRETALKEAYEEAGLRGRVVGEPVGQYEYQKWGTTLRVTVVLMHVDEAESQWPEANQRQRRWADFTEAEGLLAKPELRNLLRSVQNQLAHDRPDS